MKHLIIALFFCSTVHAQESSPQQWYTGRADAIGWMRGDMGKITMGSKSFVVHPDKVTFNTDGSIEIKGDTLKLMREMMMFMEKRDSTIRAIIKLGRENMLWKNNNTLINVNGSAITTGNAIIYHGEN